MKVQQKDNTKAKANSNFVKNRGSSESIPVSAGKIKKKIRDAQRTINKKDLPANVITEAKRRLRVLEFDLGEKIVDDHERDNSTKYHKVKHFERQKLSRKLKQAKKAVEEATEKAAATENPVVDATKMAALKEKVNEWEMKLIYVTNYPKTLPYISLFPQENENDPKSLARKTKLLEEIKQAVADGDADLTLLKKRYRDSYKEKLIERKIVAPVAPVDIEAMPIEKNDDSSSDSDANQDDFFEKA